MENRIHNKLQIARTTFLHSVVIACLFLGSFPAMAKELIGTVILSEGENTIKQGADPIRPLLTDDEIFLTDLIKTSENGRVIISYIDRAKITLRPNTLLYVKKYNKIQAEITLVKGGIRVVTGKIAERNPALFKVVTPDGVVAAQNRKSDYSVRVCKNDCNLENQKIAGKKVKTTLPVIAKIVALKGDVKITSKHKRSLAVGNPIYSTEEISSSENSFAQLQFTDGSSATVQAESAINITDFKFNQTGHEDRSIFSLIKGGLRYVTGLIGKKDRTAFRLDTPVATIGIRGTDFQVNTTSNGIVSQVNDGSINQQSQGVTVVVETGSFGFSSYNAAPVVTLAPPTAYTQEAIKINIGPEPAEAMQNTGDLFTTTAEPVESGTHVAVEEGQVSMTGPNEEVVTVDSSLSASVSSSGSVSEATSTSSFQALDTTIASPESAPAPSVNTIVIGGTAFSTSTDTASSTSAATTTVIQEQVIASPYNYPY